MSLIIANEEISEESIERVEKLLQMFEKTAKELKPTADEMFSALLTLIYAGFDLGCLEEEAILSGFDAVAAVMQMNQKEVTH